MGAAYFDDIIKLHPLFIKRVVDLPEARQEALLYFQGDGNVHGSGEGIVGALAPIDVVIRMDRSL